MLSKVIGYGASRNEALQKRLQYLLQHYRLCGVTTNVSFLRHVLSHHLFSRAQINTQSINTLLESFTPLSEENTAPYAAAVSTVLQEHHKPEHDLAPSASSWKEQRWH